MVNPFTLCGSHSFPQENDEHLHNQHQERQVRSTDSTPRTSTSSSKCSKSRRRSITNINNGHKKNPYSDRGLDKFSALLADIEEKREKIYSQFPPEDIAFVQFDFSKDNNGKPIVVVKTKPRDEEQIIQKKINSKSTTTFDDRRKYHSGSLDHNHHHQHRRRCSFKQNYNNIELATDSSLEKSRSIIAKTAADEVVVESNQDDDKKRSTSSGGDDNRNLLPLKKKMRKPGCYMSATLILILIFLALFGRSVAIMCTSIGWYMMSTVSNLSGKRSLKRNSTKKKGLLGQTHVN